MSLDITSKDTICALSSAQGMAAIAIVRACGPLVPKILPQIFKHKNDNIKPFVAMHGDIIDEQGQALDDVVCIYFPENKSFSGNAMLEIHCHGNLIIVEQILALLCKKGARLALPGEFSLRAVLNGKINLAQAESIADLIHAKSEAAKDVALKALKGGLFDKIDPVRAMIINVLAHIEARMDFPDEDLGSYDRSYLLEQISVGQNILASLVNSAAQSLKLYEGARIVICGLPNAGKSTLLNRIVGDNKAIVHKNPGTTRDVIEANFNLNGIPVVLLDIAGIRSLEEADEVERIGIEKALFELERAHLIIWLADATVPDPFSDVTIKNKLKNLNTPVIKVLNKADVLGSQQNLDFMLISAQENMGIDKLLSQLHYIVLGPNSSAGELLITRARQKEELVYAQNSLASAYSALKDALADEVVSSELRCAGLAFDRLFGSNISEDILDKIFSEFCIGK